MDDQQVIDLYKACESINSIDLIVLTAFLTIVFIGSVFSFFVITDLKRNI